jgi:hypothetical protein
LLEEIIERPAGAVQSAIALPDRARVLHQCDRLSNLGQFLKGGAYLGTQQFTGGAFGWLPIADLFQRLAMGCSGQCLGIDIEFFTVWQGADYREGRDSLIYRAFV